MEKQEFQIESKEGKPILLDITFLNNKQPKPVVVFCHGFKGFKDWGHFNLMADYFAEKGFFFVKFSFSHGGTTPEQPTSFSDLEAFGNNNFEIELNDIQTVINWIFYCKEIKPNINLDELYMTAHSRGGGVTIINATEDKRVKKIATWAGVSDYEKRISTGDIEKWEKEGVLYVENARTNQQMPMYFQLYENYLQNRTRFSIQNACEQLSIPYLIVAGEEDPVVLVDEANNLHSWSKNSELHIVKNANHVFGSKHPFTENELPKQVLEVLDKTIVFLNS